MLCFDDAKQYPPTFSSLWMSTAMFSTVTQRFRNIGKTALCGKSAYSSRRFSSPMVESIASANCNSCILFKIVYLRNFLIVEKYFNSQGLLQTWQRANHCFGTCDTRTPTRLSSRMFLCQRLLQNSQNVLTMRFLFMIERRTSFSASCISMISSSIMDLHHDM